MRDVLAADVYLRSLRMDGKEKRFAERAACSKGSTMV